MSVANTLFKKKKKKVLKASMVLTFKVLIFAEQ